MDQNNEFRLNRNSKFYKIFTKLFGDNSFVASFLNQSGIHGLGFISKAILHSTERFFWLLMIIVSVYCCILLSFESWAHFLTKSTVVSIETDHYYWNTSLPSLTICPMQRLSPKLFQLYCQHNNVHEEDREKLFAFLESLANSTYINFNKIKTFDNIEHILKDLNIRPEDYMNLIYNLTDDLTQLNSKDAGIRAVNNLEFILSIQTLTEYGICYTTNSFIGKNMSTKWLIEGLPNELHHKYYNEKVHDVRFGNLFDGDITYSFIGFDSAITIFIHSPYETMNIARNLRYATEAFEFTAYSFEIITSENLERDTKILQRDCRFITESNLTHYKIYTKGICIQECRLNLAYKTCGCIPHFYPNKIANPKRVCSYQMLKDCFPPNLEYFLQFHDDKRPNVECNCLQNCVESYVIIENLQILKNTRSLLGSIGGLIIVKKYPLLRFNRQVLFTMTDLLVSIGGAAGLFVGFNVLGVVEIIYFFTLRLFWHMCGRG